MAQGDCQQQVLSPGPGSTERSRHGLGLFSAAIVGFLHICAPFPTDPSAPLDLVLTPQPPGLSAHWRAGSGAQDGYLLRLSGLVETISLGPGALNATFPGPLPAGHYTLQLRVLAGPYDAWAQASAWLGESGLVGAGRGFAQWHLLPEAGESSLSRDHTLPRCCSREQTRQWH